MHAHGLRGSLQNNQFTLIYPLVSLVGSIAGFVQAKKWGGFKSLLGRSLSLFSLGLFAQFLGQAAYAYYIYIKQIEVPYPSLGDIGFFGSVVFYVIGAYYLALVSGMKSSARSWKGKLISVVLALIMLCLSYTVFLRGYVFDGSFSLKTVLDFGYPLGQAVYVSIALMALLFSKNSLGGSLRKPILFLLCALVIQYLSDFTFLYQVNAGTWYVGGVNDYMYLVSYFFMTLALVNIGTIFTSIKEA